MFPIVGVKNSESPDPETWKYKGRIVFGDDNIKTASDNVAMFTDKAASPSSMIAARALIAMTAVTADAAVLQSDCVQAYIQSPIQGPPTFVRLPKQWHPPSWSDFKDPCCRLLLSLYGHPLSGLYWHRHLDARLKKLGYRTIDGWSSVYHNPKSGVALVVYVDDLLAGGPAKATTAALAEIAALVSIEQPQSISKYLGCFHKITVSLHDSDQVTTAVRDAGLCILCLQHL